MLLAVLVIAIYVNISGKKAIAKGMVDKRRIFFLLLILLFSSRLSAYTISEQNAALNYFNPNPRNFLSVPLRVPITSAILRSETEEWILASKI
jgi:hypothetical protein